MLSTEFVNGYRVRYNDGDCPIFHSFNGMGYAVYKRSYARPLNDESGNTEEWPDTIERVINGAVAIGADLSPTDQEALFDDMYNLRAFVAGRMLWQLGTPNNERIGGDSLVNCWFVEVQSPDDFGFMFDELMLGGGVGFSVTEGAKFGRVAGGSATIQEGFDVDLVVPDNREGWRALVVQAIASALDGEHFTYSVDGIRPYGTPINGFGGTASGPGILVEGVTKMVDIINERQGTFLTSVDLLDIGNIIGSIVVSGNVRRSAEIALGNYDDQPFLDAKDWSSGNIPRHRSMSNNSVYVTHPDMLPYSFWEAFKSGDKEHYGLINLDSLQRYGRAGDDSRPDYSIEGVNPCAEIGLASYESCNLSELVLPHINSPKQLQEIAARLYKVNKAVAAMNYIHPKTNQVVHGNMRLGISVTGVAQAREKLSWLSPAYESLRALDSAHSLASGLNESIRLTTVKPSGTLSIVAGVTAGAHPGFGQFHIRRVRMSSSDPLINWAYGRGYRVELARDFEGNEDPLTAIVEFPVKLPNGTWMESEATAIDQLKMVLDMQTQWADNAVSISVYYSPDEIPAITQFLGDHWTHIKTVSFLLREDHGYVQAPVEQITEERYIELMEGIGGFSHANGNSSEFIDDAACATGACPVR